MQRQLPNTEVFRPSGSSRTVGTGPSEWPATIALTFVLVSILALVVVSWAGTSSTRPMYAELNNVLAPARELLVRVQVALAVEGSLLRDYLASPDESLTRRYREAVAQEQRAAAQLSGLVQRLGPEPRRYLADFRREQDEWHLAIERLLANPKARTTRDPLRGPDYEQLLDASVRFDAALGDASEWRRATIQRAELRQTRLAIGVGILGIAGGVVIAWLAHRMRSYAGTVRARTTELERANESRERLLRGITHDLKNPLQAIDGHAGLLEEEFRGPLMPDQRDSVQRIRTSVGVLLALIDDLLELARADAGELSVKPQEVDLAVLVRDITEQYRASAEASGHRVELSVKPLPAGARTDPKRVRQVLGNLMSNAIKYTPRGGTITVGAEPRDHDTNGSAGPWIAIDVADSGGGVPAEQQQSIFRDFARLDAHRGIPGAGLGLSIGKRIAELLGGDLTVRSEAGSGATFTLWLPPNSRT